MKDILTTINSQPFRGWFLEEVSPYLGSGTVVWLGTISYPNEKDIDTDGLYIHYDVSYGSWYSNEHERFFVKFDKIEVLMAKERRN